MTWLETRLSALSPTTLGLAFLALYLSLVFPAMPVVGDAADYAASIRQSDFATRTIHIGYNVFAYPFVRLGTWLGLTATVVLNGLAAVCMAATVSIVQRLYTALGCTASTSSLASIIFGTTGIIWYHAEFGEVQALLMLCIVSAAYLFLTDHEIAAGSVFGFALLVSQAAVPSLVCFPLLAYRKRSWKNLLRFGLALAVTFLACVAPIAKDYVWGPRGVIPSLSYYPPGSLLVTIAYFAYRLIENHNVWVIWLLFGILVCYRQCPDLLVGSIILWMSHVWLNLRVSHIEYGFAWMPFFTMSSLMIAIGALCAHRRYLGHRRLTASIIPLSVIVASLFSCLLYVLPKRADAIYLQSIVQDIKKTVRENTVLATPHVGFVYVYETNPSVNDVWNYTWRPLPEKTASWRAEVNPGHETFVFLYKPHTHLFRRLVVDGPVGHLVWSEEKRDQYREEGALMTQQTIYEHLPQELCLIARDAWANGELVAVQPCSPDSHVSAALGTKQ